MAGHTSNQGWNLANARILPNPKETDANCQNYSDSRRLSCFLRPRNIRNFTVQKLIKKPLTPLADFGKVVPHTVRKKHMRTKLALAAAALTAGMLTASAQSNVYSLNIVGYVNAVISSNYTLVANPLNDGNGNSMTNLIPAAALPNGSKVLLWTGSGYTTIAKKAGAWPSSPTIAPGTGYFVYNNTNIVLTNTYVGNVPGNVPGSLTNSLAAGYKLVGTPYPIGGNIQGTGSNSINLPSALPNGSKVLVWTGSGYTTLAKKAGAWPSATVNVGQGYFIYNSTNFAIDWIQDVGP